MDLKSIVDHLRAGNKEIMPVIRSLSDNQLIELCTTQYEHQGHQNGDQNGDDGLGSANAPLYSILEHATYDDVYRLHAALATLNVTLRVRNRRTGWNSAIYILVADNVEALRALIEIYKTYPGIQIRNDSHFTLLDFARSAEAVHLLVNEAECDPNGDHPDLYENYVPYRYAETPLIQAIKDGKPEVAIALLDCGANVNLRDYHRRTPLMIFFKRWCSLLTRLSGGQSSSLLGEQREQRYNPEQNEAYTELLLKLIEKESLLRRPGFRYGRPYTIYGSYTAKDPLFYALRASALCSSFASSLSSSLTSSLSSLKTFVKGSLMILLDKRYPNVLIDGDITQAAMMCPLEDFLLIFSRVIETDKRMQVQSGSATHEVTMVYPEYLITACMARKYDVMWFLIDLCGGSDIALLYVRDHIKERGAPERRVVQTYDGETVHLSGPDIEKIFTDAVSHTLGSTGALFNMLFAKSLISEIEENGYPRK